MVFYVLFPDNLQQKTAAKQFLTVQRLLLFHLCGCFNCILLNIGAQFLLKSCADGSHREAKRIRGQ